MTSSYMNKLNSKELMFLVMSNIIGIGILYMPHSMAGETVSSDGWITLLVVGSIAAILSWICTKLSAAFPQQTFFDYTSSLVSRPIAFILTMVLVGVFFCMAAYETRTISLVVSHYLLETTDVRIVVLMFLLVITYGLCGSRIALLRLNIWFLIITLLVLFLLFSLNTNLMDIHRLTPIFQTPPKQYILSMKDTAFTFSGFEIVLFYTALVEKPKTAPKLVVLGIFLLTFIYIITYLVCVSIFSNGVIQSLPYPVIELGKEIEIGDFFERFDALFFATWIMKLFTTTIMYIDVSIIALNSIVKKVKKQTIIFIIMPIIYMVTFIPQGMEEISQFGHITSLVNFCFISFIPTLLLCITFIKTKKGSFR